MSVSSEDLPNPARTILNLPIKTALFAPTLVAKASWDSISTAAPAGRLQVRSAVVESARAFAEM